MCFVRVFSCFFFFFLCVFPVFFSFFLVFCRCFSWVLLFFFFFFKPPGFCGVTVVYFTPGLRGGAFFSPGFGCFVGGVLFFGFTFFLKQSFPKSSAQDRIL